MFIAAFFPVLDKRMYSMPHFPATAIAAQAGEITQVQTQYYAFAQEQMQIIIRFILKG